jgi:hypothetical protein
MMSTVLLDLRVAHWPVLSWSLAPAAMVAGAARGDPSCAAFRGGLGFASGFAPLVP